MKYKEIFMEALNIVAIASIIELTFYLSLPLN